MCFSSASIRSSPSTYPVAPTCASNHVNDLALGTSPPQPVSSRVRPCARLSVGSGGVSQTAIIWVLVCVLRGGGRGAHFDVPLVNVCERFHRLSRWTWARLPVLDLRVVAPWAQRRQRDKESHCHSTGFPGGTARRKKEGKNSLRNRTGHKPTGADQNTPTCQLTPSNCRHSRHIVLAPGVATTSKCLQLFLTVTATSSSTSAGALLGFIGFGFVRCRFGVRSSVGESPAGFLPVLVCMTSPRCFGAGPVGARACRAAARPSPVTGWA